MGSDVVLEEGLGAASCLLHVPGRNVGTVVALGLVHRRIAMRAVRTATPSAAATRALTK